MDDDLIATADLPPERKSQIPGEGFFYPDSLAEDRSEQRVREAVDGADAVVVTDSDADGLGCIALVREAYDAALDPEPFLAERRRRLADDGVDAADEDDDGDADAEDPSADVHARSAAALVPTSPRDLASDLATVADLVEPGADVFVCDLCPDEFAAVADAVDALVASAGEVRWFDHHQWDDEVAAAVREAGVDLVVGESEAECTTDVTLRSVDYEFPERFVDLAAVTRDHDLWLKEDDRSDDLADYATWADAEEYVAVVGAHGVDLPESVRAFLNERRVEKRRLVEKAVERASVHEVDDWSVGVTYGRCSQNEVAETLREQGCDAAVVVKPYGSVSIRGSEGGFERAHEVAGRLGGGGHPQAAGCMPDLFDDMLDYARHWTTQGRATKKTVLRAFEAVAADAAEADESGNVDGGADQGGD
ncbi:MAG: DHH family phosphoesterase [Halolamina sp.]